MERRLFDDLVVSGNGAARAASFKSLPLSLAVHAGALAVLASLSVTAVTEVAAPAGRVVFPPTAKPGPTIVTPNRTGNPSPSRAQRPLVIADPQPLVVADPAADSVLDLPAADTPICLSGCTPGGGSSGVDSGTTGPGDPGGTGEGPGDGAGAPRPVGGDIQEPRRIRGAAPPYPDLARRAHVEGKVVLECVIDTDGRVTDLRVMSGHPLLAGAALDAVRGWEYIPTRLNGQPVRVILTVTVHFGLERS